MFSDGDFYKKESIMKQRHLKIVPVLLAGGEGKRLWPLSTEETPKQFLDLIPGHKNLFSKTLERVLGCELFSEPVIVSRKKYESWIQKELKDLSCEASLLWEPFAKNTLPAIVLAALLISRKDPQAFLLAMPSDHMIEKFGLLKSLIQQNIAHLSGSISIFGVEPDHPSQEYGYISYGEKPSAFGLAQVSRFIEKPDKARAEAYIKEGYVWNCGLFLVRAGVFLEKVAHYEPSILEVCQRSLQKDGSINEEEFEKCKSISMDYGLLQHMQDLKLILLPQDFGWCDVGGWGSVKKLTSSLQDQRGNILIGNVMAEDVRNCYVRSSGPLLKIAHAENLIVVENGGQVLVMGTGKQNDD